MNVLDNARTHYKQQISGELQSMEVPEWNATVYWKPSATFAQQAKVIQLSQKGELAEALVETLIARCLTQEGKKMFTFADKVVLMHEVDPDVIVRIVTAINNTKADADLGN